MKGKTNKSIRLSQNFLNNSNLVHQLVSKSSIGHEDIVFEIGAGNGIITEELAKQSKKVIAVEIDHELFNKLQTKFDSNSAVEIRLGNFLDYPLPTTPYKIYSNIPFNITADVIHKIVNAPNPPDDSYLIVQKEAAYKFAGQPQAKESRASILIKPFFEVDIAYQFRKTDFSLIPSVDIVLMRISKKVNPSVNSTNRTLYEYLISYVFSQWQPTVFDCLKSIFTKQQFSRLSNNLEFSITSTPTQLTFEQWLGIFNYFVVGVEANKKRLVLGAASKQSEIEQKLVKVHRTRNDPNWRQKKL